MFCPRSQLNGLGAAELHQPLRCTLKVQVESHRCVARNGPTQEQFRCVEQRRQPRVDQQRINARGVRTLRALVRA